MAPLQPHTKTEAALAAAELAHANDPERAEVLHRARQFKASWVELAESLSHVRKEGHWKRWGYDSFDAYAKTELRLKPETVDKLTGSFQFLKNRAPEVLRRDGVSEPIPTYQAVDFLRRAEQREAAPHDAVSEIRRRVLDEGVPLATVARQYGEKVFPLDDAERKRRDAAALKNVATRLRDLLGDTRAVPRRLAADVSTALEGLLEALGAADEKAA